MMKTLLLSLKPDVFEKILLGKKIYEHRRVFPDGPVTAYIYISRPVQALSGFMPLDNKVNIFDRKDLYKEDKEAHLRKDNFLKHHRVAMQIQMFQNTTSIKLDEIKKIFQTF